MTRFFVFLFLLLFAMAGAVLMDGGRIITYIGIPALVIEIFVPLFAILAVWKLSELRQAFKDAFNRKGEAATAPTSMRIWDFAEKACYAAGVLGWLLGTILSELTNSAGQFEASLLLRTTAVSLVAPLYAVFLALVCRILKARVEQTARNTASGEMRNDRGVHAS